jgi:hypothetical protein
MANIQPYRIVGPAGESLYPTPRQHPGKFKRRGALARDMKRAVSQLDHAELVSLSSQLCARVPALSAAVRKKNEWAFAGDSWQPIYYGRLSDWWGDIATQWLVEQVFPNALRGNVRKNLLWAIRTSGMGWDRHGDDLALFSTDSSRKLPQMTVIPGPRIGNGDDAWWSSSVGSVVGLTNASGYGLTKGGLYDGFRIYNGIIYDEQDEPVAARVLGWKRTENGKDFEQTYMDYPLGFTHGAHLASEYDWHGMGRPLPRIAASVLQWMNKEEIDDQFLKMIKLAATKNVIHKTAPGEDAQDARGNALVPITLDANQTSSGQAETVFVEYAADGDVTYIGAEEELAGLEYQNPHPNVENFAVRVLREALDDYGFPYEFLNLSSTGRAPTRLACELVNNSIWQKQSTGEERLLWFVRYAIGVGIQTGQLPEPRGNPAEAFKFTFGYPKEMSVDAGNDVTASLARLRMGLTSQRIESAKWGYVQKRIDSDRRKEGRNIVDNAIDLMTYAQGKGQELTFRDAREFFYQPGVQPSQPPQPTQPEKPDAKTETQSDEAKAASREPAERIIALNVSRPEDDSREFVLERDASGAITKIKTKRKQ